jgi:DNA-directed RNA polymerase subunit L
MAAYNVPHPLESKMHLRIETHPTSETGAVEALIGALDRTMSQCDALLKVFDRSVEEARQD